MLLVAQDRLDAGDRPPELLRRALRDVTAFQGGLAVSNEEGRRNDDATMVAVRWCPAAVGEPTGPRADRLEDAEERSPDR
jgi:hypothetical protein